MDILELIDKIRNTQGCIVYSPCSLPTLSEGVDLPNDLKVFYENWSRWNHIYLTFMRNVVSQHWIILNIISDMKQNIKTVQLC